MTPRRSITVLVAAVTFAIVSGRATRAQSTQKIERAWPVMGTMFVATVWGTDSVAMLRGVQAARDSVRLVDSLMSTYRPTSEISRVNDSAGGIPQRVSPQTMHVLLHAKRLWIASGGLFDPTVGPLVRAWGFQGDSGAVPSSARLDSLRALVGYQRVELDSAQGAVCLTRAGVRLDLGGIAKGYALDLARAALTDPRITGGMVDLGGNVLVFGRPPTGTQWVIGIRHPRYADRVLGTVSLDSGAVATSGDYEHFIRVRGVRYGHLIDPFTGYPRRGVMAATAIGPRGEWSDGVSGTLFLRPQSVRVASGATASPARCFSQARGAVPRSPTHCPAWVVYGCSIAAAIGFAPATSSRRVARVRRFTSPLPAVPIHHLDQLVVHRVGLLIAGPDRGCCAVTKVVAHELPADRPERLVHRRDLRKDVGAIAVLVHHALQAAHLAFDAAEAVAVPLFRIGIDGKRAPARCCMLGRASALDMLG